MGKKKVSLDRFRTVKVPMPRLADGEFHKLIQLRQDAGWLWSSLVEYHRWLRQDRHPWPSMIDLARQMTGQTAALGLHLGTQSQNLIFDEFLGVVATAQVNRSEAFSNGDPVQALFPWRIRPARDCHWDRRDARYVAGTGILLSLAMGPAPANVKAKLQRRSPLIIPLMSGIPKNCTALTIHYDVKERQFFLLFKVKITSTKEAALPGSMGVDLGQIRHAACLTATGASLNIKGRGLRSTQQGHNRKKAFRISRVARGRKGSRRRCKEVAKLRRESRKVRCQVDNFLHTTSRRVVNFAREQKVGHVVVGDVVGVRSKDTGKRQNQANSDWPVGRWMQLVTYKAAAMGIRVTKIDEAYTTRTCPGCGKIKSAKVSGRIFQCSHCGLRGHRDAVGAWNILVKWHVNADGQSPAFKPDVVAEASQKYHTPVGVRGVRRSPNPRRPAPVVCSAEHPRSDPGLPGFEARHSRNSARRGTSPTRDRSESRSASSEG